MFGNDGQNVDYDNVTFGSRPGPTGTPPIGVPVTPRHSGGVDHRADEPPAAENGPIRYSKQARPVTFPATDAEPAASDGHRPVCPEDPKLITIEFESHARTYRVQSPSIQMWNVHTIARISDKMTLETDLRTGEKIFVTWSQIGVIRLASPVGDDGFRTR